MTMVWCRRNLYSCRIRAKTVGLWEPLLPLLYPRLKPRSYGDICYLFFLSPPRLIYQNLIHEQPAGFARVRVPAGIGLLSGYFHPDVTGILFRECDQKVL